MSGLLPGQPAVRQPHAGWPWALACSLRPSCCSPLCVGFIPWQQASQLESSSLFLQLLLKSEDTFFRNFQETCPPVSLSEWAYTHSRSSTCRQVGQPQPIKPQPELSGRPGVTNLNQICSAWKEKGQVTRTWPFLSFLSILKILYMLTVENVENTEKHEKENKHPITGNKAL